MAKKKDRTGTEGPSKMSMVREALAELGADAKPRDLDEYIQKKFGAVVNPQMISAYKSTINGGGGAGRSRAGKGGPGVAVNVGDVQAVRGLIERMGAAQLSQLVKVLS